MEELYSIMRDFLEIEYNQESLISVLKAVEAAYSQEQQPTAKYTANTAKYFLTALQKDFRAAVNRLDNYIAETAKAQNK